jgi:hypothetical protein
VIVGAAVCPGAPFLIEGTADAIATRLQPVTLAAADAVARLPRADLTVLIAGSTGTRGGSDRSGPGPRVLLPGTRIPTTSVRRSDLPDPHALALSRSAANGAVAQVSDPAVGTMVGAFLLAAAERRRPIPVPSHPGRHQGARRVQGARPHRQLDSDPLAAADTVAVEIDGDQAAAARALSGFLGSAQRVALLVIADGSACHGDAAPGRRDDRADAFDLALARALAAGDPGALRAATTDRALAGELLASVDPLALLALLTAERPPDGAELLYGAAPLGVGYLIASWGWAGS